MHHDSQMYYVPNGLESRAETNTANSASTWMMPMTGQTPRPSSKFPQTSIWMTGHLFSLKAGMDMSTLTL